MHGFMGDLNLFILNCLFVAVRYACYLFALTFAFHGAVDCVHTMTHLFSVRVSDRNYRPAYPLLILTAYSFALAGFYFFMTRPYVWDFLKHYFYYNVVLTVVALVFGFYLPAYFYQMWKIVSYGVLNSDTGNSNSDSNNNVG